MHKTKLNETGFDNKPLIINWSENKVQLTESWMS